MCWNFPWSLLELVQSLCLLAGLELVQLILFEPELAALRNGSCCSREGSMQLDVEKQRVLNSCGRGCELVVIGREEEEKCDGDEVEWLLTKASGSMMKNSAKI